MFIAQQGLTNFWYKFVSKFVISNFYTWSYVVINGFESVRLSTIIDTEKFVFFFIIVSYIWENMGAFAEYWIPGYTMQEEMEAERIAEEWRQIERKKRYTLKQARNFIVFLTLTSLIFMKINLGRFSLDYTIKLLFSSITYYLFCIGLYKIKILK